MPPEQFASDACLLPWCKPRLKTKRLPKWCSGQGGPLHYPTWATCGSNRRCLTIPTLQFGRITISIQPWHYLKQPSGMSCNFQARPPWVSPSTWLNKTSQWIHSQPERAKPGSRYSHRLPQQVVTGTQSLWSVCKKGYGRIRDCGVSYYIPKTSSKQSRAP